MITINGKEYQGNNLNVVNGQVMIDGKPIDPSEITTDTTKIEVSGGLTALHVDNGVVTVNGDVGGDVTGKVINVSGDIKGEVTASVVNNGSAVNAGMFQQGHTTIIPGMTINA
jgi:hypothetical protein